MTLDGATVALPSLGRAAHCPDHFHRPQSQEERAEMMMKSCQICLMKHLSYRRLNHWLDRICSHPSFFSVQNAAGIRTTQPWSSVSLPGQVSAMKEEMGARQGPASRARIRF